MSRNNRYAALAALGEMAKGAGSYFGQVHAEKVKAERLAQARSQELQDIEADREWQTERDRLQYARSQQNIQDSADAQIRVAKAKQDMKPESGKNLDRIVTDGEGFQWARYEDGSWERQDHLGQKGAGKPEKLTSWQAVKEMRAKGVRQGLGDMMTAMGQGFDPTSLEGGLSRLAVSFPLTNATAPEDAQLFDRGASQIKENFMRDATGAVINADEYPQYERMFIPRFGDTEAVVAAKLDAIEAQMAAMEELSRGYTEEALQNPEVARGIFEQASQQVAEQYRLDELTASVSQTPGTPSVRSVRDIRRGNNPVSSSQSDILAGEAALQQLFGPDA